jgi:hypothetical protein
MDKSAEIIDNIGNGNGNNNDGIMELESDD